MTTPTRTCIGCRERRPDRDLVRITNDAGRVRIGVRGSGGRGAWLCPDPACVDAAEQRRAFSRAFRSKIADALFADTLRGWLAARAQS